jgi:hypothetical protein
VQPNLNIESKSHDISFNDPVHRMGCLITKETNLVAQDTQPLQPPVDITLDVFLVRYLFEIVIGFFNVMFLITRTTTREKYQHMLCDSYKHSMKIVSGLLGGNQG